MQASMPPRALLLALALALAVAASAVAALPPGAASEDPGTAPPPTASPEGRIDVSSQKLRCLYLPGVKSSPEAPPPTYIDASNNLLTDVGDNALTGLFLLRYLNLSGNLLHEWGRYPFRDLRSLQLLDVSRNQLRNVDRVVLEPLQALRRLNLSANRIQYLDAAAFPRLERLHDLDLTRNDMEVIADDAFARLGALQRLDLRWNRLSTLGERTLRGLTAVQSVLLGGNVISEAVPGALQGLNSLSEISLADNGQVVDLVLVGNRLQRVDLSRVGLSAMPAALTRSVRALVLPGNNVRIISCGDLDSFPLLQALELSGNGLALVEDDALGRLEQLETLVLRNNSLMMIPPSLPESLVTLQLQHNQIRHIGANDLRGLRQLQRLDLSCNQVHHIHDGAFRFLESLQELDLSANKLLELRAAALAGPVALRSLGLARLSDIAAPAKWLPFPIERPERLQTLDLDQSPQLARQLLADTAALMAMPHLQALRLGSAELHHLRPDLPRLLSHLQHLRLADNPWHCAGLRWLPRWLQALDKDSATNATCRQPGELAGLQLRNLTVAHFNASQLEDGDEEEPAPPLALPLAPLAPAIGGPSPDEEVSIPINEYKRIMIELNKTMAREAAAAAAAASSTPGPNVVAGSGQPINTINLTSPVATEGTEAPAPPPVAAALSATINSAAVPASTAAPIQSTATPSATLAPSTLPTIKTNSPTTPPAADTPATSTSVEPTTTVPPTTPKAPSAPTGTASTAGQSSTAPPATIPPSMPTAQAIKSPTEQATEQPPTQGPTEAATAATSEEGTPTSAAPTTKTTQTPTTTAPVATSTATPAATTTKPAATSPTAASPTPAAVTTAPPSTPSPPTSTPPSGKPSTAPSTAPSTRAASTATPWHHPTAPPRDTLTAVNAASAGRGEPVLASSLRHGSVHAEAAAPHDGMSRHTTSVVAMFAVAACCSVAVLLAFAIARNSRHRRQQLLRLHSMEDLVLRGRGPDCSAECGADCGTPRGAHRASDSAGAAAPELW